MNYISYFTLLKSTLADWWNGQCQQKLNTTISVIQIRAFICVRVWPAVLIVAWVTPRRRWPKAYALYILILFITLLPVLLSNMMKYKSFSFIYLQRHSMLPYNQIVSHYSYLSYFFYAQRPNILPRLGNTSIPSTMHNICSLYIKTGVA